MLLLLLLLLLAVLLAMLLAISGPGKAGGISRRLINMGKSLFKVEKSAFQISNGESPTPPRNMIIAFIL